MKRKSVPRVRNTKYIHLSYSLLFQKVLKKRSQMLWRLHDRLSSWKFWRQVIATIYFSRLQGNAFTPCNYWLDDCKLNDCNRAGQMFSEGCLPPSLRYVTYIVEWEKLLLQVTDFHTCTQHACAYKHKVNIKTTENVNSSKQDYK